MKGLLSLAIIALGSAFQPTPSAICGSGLNLFPPNIATARLTTALFLKDVDFDGPPPLNQTYFLLHRDSSFFDGFSFDLRHVGSALEKYNRDVYPFYKLPAPNLRDTSDIRIKFRSDWNSDRPLPFELDRLFGQSEVRIAGAARVVRINAAATSGDADISLIWCRDVPSGSLLRRPCPGLELDPDYKVEPENLSGRSVSAFVFERVSGKTVGEGRDKYYGYQLWVKPSGKATCSLISDGSEADTFAAANACMRRRLDVEAPLSVRSGTIPLTNLSVRLSSLCD